MPNRILKESICTSENIDQLSAFQETVFYRLIVNCDDYGRMDARPKLLASLLFPLKEIRASQIEDALRKLTSAELVTLYTVGGKPFLQMNTWNRHQRVRDSKEKYPGPEKSDFAASCGELPQVAASCGELRPESNPTQSESQSQSESEAQSESKSARAGELADGFDLFWAAYPRHTAKETAKKAFDKLNPSAELLTTILDAISRQKTSVQWTKDGGQFIPHPATWLNQHRWEDELPTQGQPYNAFAEYAMKLAREGVE